MTTILHMSDIHDNDGNRLECLGELARLRSDVDVIAFTGDYLWPQDQLPKGLNEWPQQLKLSVPGDHDGKKTFDLLCEWSHKTPYVTNSHDITFIGLDSSNDLKTGRKLSGSPRNSDADAVYDACIDFDSDEGYRKVKKQLCCEGDLINSGCALVVLSHRWPQPDKAARVWDMMRTVCDGRPLLILCGHEHHRLVKPMRPPWSQPTVPGIRCFRSQVHTQYNTVHLITWDGKRFTYNILRT